MKLIFCLQLNIKFFLKLMPSIKCWWPDMPIFTQNNKVAISLQYIKKKVSDEIGFPHVDKHESSLQIDNDI